PDRRVAPAPHADVQRLRRPGRQSVRRDGPPEGLLRTVRRLVLLAALLPLLHLVWDGFTGGLAAEPVKDITHRTGWWALTLLLVTLAVTPLRRLTGRNSLIQLRRPLGLLAF